jgi:hypothetical protein
VGVIRKAAARLFPLCKHMHEFLFLSLVTEYEIGTDKKKVSGGGQQAEEENMKTGSSNQQTG